MRANQRNHLASSGGIGSLSVAESAGFVDDFRRQPEITNRCRSIPVRKTFRPAARNLPTLLRCIGVGENNQGALVIFRGDVAPALQILIMVMSVSGPPIL